MISFSVELPDGGSVKPSEDGGRTISGSTPTTGLMGGEGPTPYKADELTSVLLRALLDGSPGTVIDRTAKRSGTVTMTDATVRHANGEVTLARFIHGPANAKGYWVFWQMATSKGRASPDALHFIGSWQTTADTKTVPTKRR
jgi:hypothetical protein